MNKINSLWDAGIMADDAFVSLEQTASTLALMLDSLENEGIRESEARKPATAVNIVARLPQYMDMLYLLSRDMRNTLDILHANTDSIFEAHWMQKMEAGT